MQEEGASEAGGVMHCFTESWEVAQGALKMGFHISFSGIVTFKNAKDLKDVASKVPLDRLLVETDAPFLAPQPTRGKRNEPAFMVHTAAMLAELKDVSAEDIAAATTENFFRLFTKARPA
jgi:TatD DNase family protein